MTAKDEGGFRRKKMNKQLLIVAMFSLVLSSCAEHSGEEALEKTAGEMRAKQTLATTEKEVKNAEQVIEIKNNGAIKQPAKTLANPTRTASINGDKFKLFSPKNIQGSKVFNVAIQQYGTLSGGIVIVATPEQLTSVDLSQYHVQAIAKNTHRLTPPTDVDLVNEYKKLVARQAFSVVELAIDYSPSNQATY